MNRQLRHGVVLALSIAALCACSDRTSGTQHGEAPANRGEAATGATDDSFESSCTRVGGKWETGAQHCLVTEALCANFGQWHEGIGCVMASVGPAECVGLSGLQVVGDSCVIAHLASDELAQTGLSEEK
jgi:hypothetical protein